MMKPRRISIILVRPENVRKGRYTTMIKDSARTRILKSALPDVAFDGWTDALLGRAAKKAKASAEKEFPDGVTGLIRHFSFWADDEMEAKLAKSRKKPDRVRDKVTLGVWTRLELLRPYKQAVSSSLSYMSRPTRNFILPKLVWQTADRIWQYADDTSTDYNRYTKRILLSGVITATTLYWLNDKSDGHEKTKVFLDRRIDNVLDIGRKLSTLKGRKSA